MGLLDLIKESGNVIYYGIVASVFGGWVPVRSIRNIDLKLIVFHLYLILSMLALPLLIHFVSEGREGKERESEIFSII
jgi:hypothetical protein